MGVAGWREMGELAHAGVLRFRKLCDKGDSYCIDSTGMAMRPDAIFQPMGALAALTLIVALLIAVQRFTAAFRGEVDFEDFRFGESTRVPGQARLPNRNYINLLEAPVLFYVVCLSAYVTSRVTPPIVGLAWVYVALRAAHSIVHVTYNNVLHRFLAYVASNVVLGFLWALFFF
jgi:hypothetical protein